MYKIKLEIAYDGAAYLGWQDVKTGAHIEASIKRVLEQILQEEIHLEAASRTDSGVHAIGQVACFTCEKLPSLTNLKKSLNSLLADDIRIRKIDAVDLDFHPSLDCISKEYHYQVCFDEVQMPCERFSFWHYPAALDLEIMRQEAADFIGEKDFSAFCNQPQKDLYEHCIRKIERIDIFELPQKRLRFEIEGNRFLFRMVRNIVGYLLYVGSSRLPAKGLSAILESKKRENAGITADAKGLFLVKVKYK